MSTFFRPNHILEEAQQLKRNTSTIQTRSNAYNNCNNSIFNDFAGCFGINLLIPTVNSWDDKCTYRLGNKIQNIGLS